MTKTKLWLSIFALSSVLLMGTIAIQPIAFADDDDDDDDAEYLEIEESHVKIRNGKLVAHIETDDKIPKNGSGGPFGYGILTSGLENVLAITTHLCAADSPVQNNAPDSVCDPDKVVGLLEALTMGALKDVDFDGAKWHTHVLDLKEPDGFCASIGADLEVNIETSPDNNISPTPADGYKLKVRGDSVWVKAPLGDNNINPDGTGVAVVSFTLDLDAENGVITDLCLLNISSGNEDDDD